METGAAISDRSRMPKRGRPRSSEPRIIRKEVRFSEAEYARLCLASLKLRMDVSCFIREMILTPDPFSVRIKNTELT